MAAPRHPHPWRGCCGPSSFGWRNKREAALTQHAVAPHGVAGPSGALARGGTVRAKIPLRAGVVAAEREKKGGEMPPGTGGPGPALLPPLPGSPVAGLAEAGTRHGVAAPPNALGAEELASVPEGARGAGAVAAAETKQGGVRVPGPPPGPTAASCTQGAAGGTWVPSSRARSAGTIRSPHRRRPRAGSGGTAGGSPRRGSRGRSAPCTGSRSSRAGTPGRSRPRASRAGCACSSRSCTGIGVARPRHPPPKKRGVLPHGSIDLGHGEMPQGRSRAG